MFVLPCGWGTDFFDRVGDVCLLSARQNITKAMEAGLKWTSVCGQGKKCRRESEPVGPSV